MTSRKNKLISPLTKFSFQSPTDIEYFPEENFIRKDSLVQNFYPFQTPTNFNSGFIEASSGVRVNHSLGQTNLHCGSRTRSSNPCPQNNSRIPLGPNLSHLRPSKIIKPIIIDELLGTRQSRHHASKPDLLNFVFNNNKTSQQLMKCLYYNS